MAILIYKSPNVQLQIVFLVLDCPTNSPKPKDIQFTMKKKNWKGAIPFICKGGTVEYYII